MKSFRQYIFEKYNFGATAFGLATIDKVTAKDQEKADRGVRGYEGFNQRVGSSGREYIPAYSVASRTLPAGTMIKVTDRRTGEPVGKKFGNVDGIYRVDGTGGPQTKNNIDFFSGENKEMMNYYASYGVNSNNLDVEVLNMAPNSPQEKEVLSKLEKYKSGMPPESEPADPASSAFANLQQNVQNIFKTGMGREQAKTALDTVLNTAKGAIKGALPAGVRLPF